MPECKYVSMSPAGQDWEELYRGQDTAWDLRMVTPPLEALARSGRLAQLVPAQGRIALPGCGRGHDVRFLASLGYDVTGFDIAPSAVAEASALLALNRATARVLLRDVLGLLPEFAGRFELVYDYTCLCALPPPLRPSYLAQVHGMLAPGGVYLALVYPMREDRAGPGRAPYLVTDAQLRALLAGGFELLDVFEPEASVARRRGAERWYVARRT